MATKSSRLLFDNIILDLHASLPELLGRAGVTWMSPKDEDVFLAHGWPTSQAEHQPTGARCFAVLSTFNPEGALILKRALLDGRCICPATLHEVLALAAIRPALEWTHHDLAIVGTLKGNLCPTIALRENKLYLGVERLAQHDPPSYIMVSY